MFVPSRPLVSLVLFSALASNSLAQASLRSSPNLAHSVPGQMHGGILVNLPLLIEDFPKFVDDGWVGESIERFTQKGYPDFRKLAFELGVGLNIRNKSLSELILMTKGRLRIAKRIRDLSRAAGLPVKERAYRGVSFLSPAGAKFGNFPVEVAEVREGVSFFHLDNRRRFRTGNLTVETVQGRNHSFAQKHGLDLDSETYLSLGIRVPLVNQKEIQERLAAAKAEVVLAEGAQRLGFVVQGGADWRRDGSKVKLGCEFETFTTWEAKLLADWLIRKRVEWIASQTNPYVKRFLEATEVRREGKSIFFGLKIEWDVQEQQAQLAREGLFLD